MKKLLNKINACVSILKNSSIEAEKNQAEFMQKKLTKKWVSKKYPELKEVKSNLICPD